MPLAAHVHGAIDHGSTCSLADEKGGDRQQCQWTLHLWSKCAFQAIFVLQLLPENVNKLLFLAGNIDILCVV